MTANAPKDDESFTDSFKYRLLNFLAKWRFSEQHIGAIENSVSTIVEARLHTQRDEFMQEIRVIENNIVEIKASMKTLLIVATLIVPVFTAIAGIVITKVFM